MSALIHSTLPINGHAVLADSGAVRDPESLFVTRKRRILFRGTENELVAAFTPGDGGSPSGGANMLCAGPTAVELCEGCATDPHWETQISWLGLHTGWNDAAQWPDFQYRIIANWSRTETQFPIVNEEPGGGDWTTYISTPFVTSITNSLGGPTRARLINFVPMLQVIGVIKWTGVGPLSPFTGRLQAFINSLNTTYAPPTAAIQDWTALPDPMLTYAKGFLTAAKQTGTQGSYVPATLQSRRELNVGDLHAFTLDLTWEQGKTPG